VTNIRLLPLKELTDIVGAPKGHKKVGGKLVVLLVTTLTERNKSQPVDNTPPALMPINYYPAGMLYVFATKLLV
jgi:hypothetical protein